MGVNEYPKEFVKSIERMEKIRREKFSKEQIADMYRQRQENHGTVTRRFTDREESLRYQMFSE